MKLGIGEDRTIEGPNSSIEPPPPLEFTIEEEKVRDEQTLIKLELDEPLEEC